MRAAEAPRLGPPIGAGFECGNGDPALFAKFGGAIGRRADRQQQAALPPGVGQGSQDRVGIQRKAGRRLGRRRVARLITSAAAQFATRPVERAAAAEKCKADPGMVLKAAVFDRVDRHLEGRSGVPEPIEHGTKPDPLGPCLRRQIEAIERGQSRVGRTCRRQQPAQQFTSPAGNCRDRGGVLVIECGAQTRGPLARNAKGLDDGRNQCRQSNVDR